MVQCPQHLGFVEGSLALSGGQSMQVYLLEDHILIIHPLSVHTISVGYGGWTQ